MGQVVSRATGFVVRDEKARPYLVTNRHVVTGRNSLDGNQPILHRDGREVIAPSALRIAMPSRERPGVWKLCVYDLGNKEYKPTWLEHPDLGWKVDVIALPIDVDDEALDPPPVPMTPFPAQLRIATKVFVVGFPMGFDPFTAPGAIGVWDGRDNGVAAGTGLGGAPRDATGRPHPRRAVRLADLVCGRRINLLLGLGWLGESGWSHGLAGRLRRPHSRRFRYRLRLEAQGS